MNEPKYDGVCPCCNVQHEGEVLQMIGKDAEFAKWKTAMVEHAALVAVAEAAGDVLRRMAVDDNHSESVMTFNNASTFPADLRKALANLAAILANNSK